MPTTDTEQHEDFNPWPSPENKLRLIQLSSCVSISVLPRRPFLTSQSLSKHSHNSLLRMQSIFSLVENDRLSTV